MGMSAKLNKEDPAQFTVLDRGIQKAAKTCVVCRRPFTWRKKWERCWDEVQDCSDKCKRERKAQNSGAKKQDSGALVRSDDDTNTNTKKHGAARLKPNVDVDFARCEKNANQASSAEATDDAGRGRDGEDVVGDDSVERRHPKPLSNLRSCSSSSRGRNDNEVAAHAGSEDYQEATQAPAGACAGNYTCENSERAEVVRTEVAEQTTDLKTEGSCSRRFKTCAHCKDPRLELAYRVRYEKSREWRFICRDCWPIISDQDYLEQHSDKGKKTMTGGKEMDSETSTAQGKAQDKLREQANPYYQYGGTWKATIGESKSEIARNKKNRTQGRKGRTGSASEDVSET